MNVGETAKRVLVTGIEGFTGRYVAQELKQFGHDVFGLSESTEGLGRGVFKASLLDRATLAEVVERVQPEWVVHLAAIAFVAHDDVEAIYRTNIVGTRNLLSALAAMRKIPDAVLIASSANIYGNARQSLIAENTPPNPANDYAVSKLAMEGAVRLWQDKLPLIVTRPFNYTGVGQSAQFLIPKIVAHFQRRASAIELGNLDVARDFSDVRCVAQIYRRLLKVAPLGQTFNICSGRSHSLTEIVTMVTELSGHQIDVRVNPAFVRENEVRELGGDATKLIGAIGTLPTISLRETLAWMLNA